MPTVALTRRFRAGKVVRSEEGASAVEYALLVAAIAAIILLVVFALGGYVKGAFTTTCNNFNSAGMTTAVTAATCGS